ncbi:MAG: histidine phosphatase family protein [Polyangiales bacterium]
MSIGVEYPPGEVPASLIESWRRVPEGVHAALLMRHSYRPSIPKQGPDVVDLTEEGVRLARELGTHLRTRPVGRLLASRVPRCVSTARALAEGADWSVQPVLDERLINPWTVDVEGRHRAHAYWSTHPRTIDAIKLAMSDGIPGWRPLGESVEALVDAMLEAPIAGALDVLVTHDLMVGSVVEWLLRPGLEKVPRFLEGLFVWRVEGGIALAWRGEVRELPWPPR